jgi:hypothetical protein
VVVAWNWILLNKVSMLLRRKKNCCIALDNYWPPCVDTWTSSLNPLCKLHCIKHASLGVGLGVVGSKKYICYNTINMNKTKQIAIRQIMNCNNTKKMNKLNDNNKTRIKSQGERHEDEQDITRWKRTRWHIWLEHKMNLNNMHKQCILCRVTHKVIIRIRAYTRWSWSELDFSNTCGQRCYKV